MTIVVFWYPLGAFGRLGFLGRLLMCNCWLVIMKELFRVLVSNVGVLICSLYISCLALPELLKWDFDDNINILHARVCVCVIC